MTMLYRIAAPICTSLRWCAKQPIENEALGFAIPYNSFSFKPKRLQCNRNSRCLPDTPKTDPIFRVVFPRNLGTATTTDVKVIRILPSFSRLAHYLACATNCTLVKKRAELKVYMVADRFQGFPPYSGWLPWTIIGQGAVTSFTSPFSTSSRFKYIIISGLLLSSMTKVPGSLRRNWT